MSAFHKYEADALSRQRSNYRHFVRVISDVYREHRALFATAKLFDALDEGFNVYYNHPVGRSAPTPEYIHMFILNLSHIVELKRFEMRRKISEMGGPRDTSEMSDTQLRTEYDNLMLLREQARNLNIPWYKPAATDAGRRKQFVEIGTLLLRYEADLNKYDAERPSLNFLYRRQLGIKRSSINYIPVKSNKRKLT